MEKKLTNYEIYKKILAEKWDLPEDSEELKIRMFGFTKGLL